MSEVIHMSAKCAATRHVDLTDTPEYRQLLQDLHDGLTEAEYRKGLPPRETNPPLPCNPSDYAAF